MDEVAELPLGLFTIFCKDVPLRLAKLCAPTARHIPTPVGALREAVADVGPPCRHSGSKNAVYAAPPSLFSTRHDHVDGCQPLGAHLNHVSAQLHFCLTQSGSTAVKSFKDGCCALCVALSPFSHRLCCSHDYTTSLRCQCPVFVFLLAQTFTTSLKSRRTAARGSISRPNISRGK